MNLTAASALMMLVAVLTCISASAAANTHIGDCARKEGVERARCERHEKMFAKCGPLKGEEHFACDREFLLANPLDCSKQAGEEKTKCEKEGAAFKTCEPNPGREFMRCVRREAGSSPMGH